jgi:hypothetical protein
VVSSWRQRTLARTTLILATTLWREIRATRPTPAGASGGGIAVDRLEDSIEQPFASAAVWANDDSAAAIEPAILKHIAALPARLAHALHSSRRDGAEYSRVELNHRHPVYNTGALTTELRERREARRMPGIRESKLAFRMT